MERTREHLLIDIPTIGLCALLAGTRRIFAALAPVVTPRTVGQVVVRDKTNEIGAIPGLAARLPSSGSLSRRETSRCWR